MLGAPELQNVCWNKEPMSTSNRKQNTAPSSVHGTGCGAEDKPLFTKGTNNSLMGSVMTNLLLC